MVGLVTGAQTTRARDERDTPRPIFVAVVGPTCAGKSALALAVSRELDGELVGCDALQVYRGLDIGTAKLSPGSGDEPPHHMLDVVEAGEEFSAADYISRAAPIIRDLAARGKLPIVVGGTGLYLRALRRGLFEGPGRSPELRARLSRMATRFGTGALHRTLRRWDPASATRVHPNDFARLVRALEVCLTAGRPMSALMPERQSPLAGFRDILLGLRPSRELLAKRVEARVDEMFARGLVDEVRWLRDEFGAEAPAFKAIGYREILAVLDAGKDSSDARDAIVRATLRYAKRQMTWFRREDGVRWFDGFGDEPELQERVSRFLRRGMETDALARPPKMETLNAETASERSR